LVALIVIGLWPRGIAVETALITRGPLVVTVDEEGMTRVKNRYVVSAPVGGQLRRIDWKPGALVEANKTVLATLETKAADFLDTRSQAQAEARLRAAEAAREAARIQRERAAASAKMSAADLERLQQLNREKVLSPQEFDLAQLRTTTAAQDERAAEFGLKIAEFEVEQARALLVRQQSGTEAEPLAITSPVNGRILRVFQESERVVLSGLVLMEIGDPTDLEVRIEVLSRDAAALPPGARVIFEQWGGPDALPGRVRWVEPSAFTKISALGVEEQRVYVVADFTGPLESRLTLGDSYRVEARIVMWEELDTLRAPAGALFQRNADWEAFVVDGRRATLRKVKVGRSNGALTEVVGGLEEGEAVVIYPGDKVTQGIRVKPLTVGLR